MTLTQGGDMIMRQKRLHLTVGLRRERSTLVARLIRARQGTDRLVHHRVGNLERELIRLNGEIRRLSN